MHGAYNPLHVVSQSKKRRKKKSFLPAIIFLIITALLGMVVVGHFNQNDTSDEQAGSVQLLTGPTVKPLPTESVPMSRELEKVVQEALEGTHGTYGIVVKNLKSGEYYEFNPDTTFQAASLYKLWVMGATYELISDGHLKESDMLSQKASDLYAKFGIATDSAKTGDTVFEYSVGEAINQMIIISDNDAALLLTERVGLKTLSAWLARYGFTDSHVSIDGLPPRTTARETADFFNRLYLGKVINKDYSQKMLTILRAQKLNDKIPQKLPDSTIVAHKTGELDEYTHDAGIVYADTGEYILVLLSKSEEPDLAKERLVNISDAVYRYFFGQ